MICGRAIIAPLVVKIGTKAPDSRWRVAARMRTLGKVRRVSFEPRVSLPARVFTGLTDRKFMKQHFPMLLTSGFPDLGLTIHSHFLTFLVGVGQALDYAAVAECPIWWGRDIGLGEVRADSVWFEKTGAVAALAFEFERSNAATRASFATKSRTRIASASTPSLQLSVLIYWVRSGSAPQGMGEIIRDLSRRVPSQGDRRYAGPHATNARQVRDAFCLGFGASSVRGVPARRTQRTTRPREGVVSWPWLCSAATPARNWVIGFD